MNRFFCFLIISLLFVSGKNAFGRIPEGNLNRLKVLEDSLRKIGPKVFQGRDETKKLANQKFIQFMEEALNVEGAFEYPFDSLKFMACLTAPDKSFRIFNWNLPHDDGTHQYFGYVMNLDPKTKKPRVWTLTDRSDEIRNPEQATLTCEKWYGALYYKIIQTSYKRKKYYTLLGWDGNTSATWKKLIEVIAFAKDGTPSFGANIFERGKKTTRRVIFEFRAELIMKLNYEEENKQIVFDHLAPETPSAEGMYQFYTQTFSYDAFLFKKGKWILKEDIDARNPSDKKRDGKYIPPVGDQNLPQPR